MQSGTPPSVLLVHSGGLSSRQWRKLGEQLAPTHRVLAPDLIGYGGEPWPIGVPFHFRQDVVLLAAQLAEAGPAHVVGHSYGGLLALQLALAHPELVRSLALFEPVAFGILDASEDAGVQAELAAVGSHYVMDAAGVDERWLAGFVDWWNGPGAWAGLAPEVQASFRAVGWKLYQEVASLMADTTGRATYATIVAPTLLLGGGRSPAAERHVLAELAAVLPHATLEIFADMGHMGPVTHAARVNAAIVEFIRAR